MQFEIEVKENESLQQQPTKAPIVRPKFKQRYSYDGGSQLLIFLTPNKGPASDDKNNDNPNDNDDIDIDIDESKTQFTIKQRYYTKLQNQITKTQSKFAASDQCVCLYSLFAKYEYNFDQILIESEIIEFLDT